MTSEQFSTTSIDYSGQYESESALDEPQLDHYLNTDPEYLPDEALQDKVQIDMIVEAAIGLDKPALALSNAISTTTNKSLSDRFRTLGAR